MIVSCAPLRFSFNGGGSDLPFYSDRYEGKVVSVTLDRYVYVTVNRSFSKHFRLAYSHIEEVNSIDAIAHPIIRACLKEMNIKDYLEITSIGDVPANGSGLGSSSAFTVALLQALHEYVAKEITPEQLAALACKIEIERCNEPIGRQDQYASAIGGLNSLTFKKGGGVDAERIFHDHATSERFIFELNNHLSFFHLPIRRDASKILKLQSDKLRRNKEFTLLTQKLYSLAEESIISIRDFNFEKLGKLLTAGWDIKSQLNGDSSESAMREIRERVELSGAYGGKLLGAGAGGFIAVVSDPEDKNRVRSLFSDLHKVDFVARDTSPQILKIGRSEYNRS